MVRLIRASGDYISQYHEETRDAYARAGDVDFEYRQDEYHRHWATSIGETFDFHMRAFDEPGARQRARDVPPRRPLPRVRGVGLRRCVPRAMRAGFTCLEDVRQGGLRVTTRRWAPGRPASRGARGSPSRTAPLYRAGARYTRAGPQPRRPAQTAIARGHRRGRRPHHLRRWTARATRSASTARAPAPQPPVLLPLTAKDRLRCAPGADVALPVRIYNPRAEPMTDVAVELPREYPTVEAAVGHRRRSPRSTPGAFADLSGQLKARFTAGAGYFAPARLHSKMVYDGWHESQEEIDVLVAPGRHAGARSRSRCSTAAPRRFAVFRQKGNQGGGGAVERTVTEGKGNGNGILEPGEEATIWVKLRAGHGPVRQRQLVPRQGLHRLAVARRGRGPGGAEAARMDRRQGAHQPGPAVARHARRNRDPAAARQRDPGATTSRPDVRYGREKLYQAFQLHTRHLHKYELKVGGGRKR